MAPPLVWLLAVALAVLFILAYASAQGSRSPGSSLGQAPSVSPDVGRTPAPLPRLTATQARATTVVTAFLDAYNGGDLIAATDLLSDDVVAGDCDYRKRGETGARGKPQVSAWLRERMADHDRFVGLDNLYFGEPNPVGQFAVAVSYTRRTSDSLRSVGFENGIAPRFAIKVVLTPAGDRVLAWVVGQCPDA